MAVLARLKCVECCLLTVKRNEQLNGALVDPFLNSVPRVLLQPKYDCGVVNSDLEDLSGRRRGGVFGIHRVYMKTNI